MFRKLPWVILSLKAGYKFDEWINEWTSSLSDQKRYIFAHFKGVKYFSPSSPNLCTDGQTKVNSLASFCWNVLKGKCSTVTGLYFKKYLLQARLNEAMGHI